MEEMYCDIIITATEFITIAKTEHRVECKRNTNTQVIGDAIEQCWLNLVKFPKFVREDPTDKVKDLLSSHPRFLRGKSKVEIIKCEVVDAKCERDRDSCFYLLASCPDRTTFKGVCNSRIFCNNLCYLKFTPGDDDLSFELYYNVRDDDYEKNPEDSE